MQISIIIPCYNVERYLPLCLDSVLRQTFRGSKEIILIDDGSTDSTGLICDSFKQTYEFSLVFHEENKGLSEARNRGIMAASGDWLLFLDADDWLAPDALKSLLEYAETQPCDMVVGSFYYAYDSYLLYDDRWFKNRTPFVINREDAMRELILQHYFKNFAWGKLYRTQTVKEHLFRPGVFFEDVYWQHLIIHEAHRIGVIPRPIYFYRQRSDSISGRFSERNLDLLKGAKERLAFLRQEYKELVPLAEKQFVSLVQTSLDAAENIENQTQKDVFVSFAKENSIVRKTKPMRLFHAILSRLKEKKPTIIPIK